MPVAYRSQTVRKETLHTVSLVAPYIRRGASVLDVGCGEGWVLEELRTRGVTDVTGTDIVDIRRNRGFPFHLYDGRTLPFGDRQFDFVMLTFVLHHVPDDRKLALLEEALRVSRGKVFIVEDTPSTAIDRLVSRRHGEHYRKRIRSTAPYGFLTAREWQWLFRGMGIKAEVRRLSRFCRSLLQPFARTLFVIERSASAI